LSTVAKIMQEILTFERFFLAFRWVFRSSHDLDF
jgi:hypothetical protein